jgi:hypothetical protein
LGLYFEDIGLHLYKFRSPIRMCETPVLDFFFFRELTDGCNLQKEEAVEHFQRVFGSFLPPEELVGGRSKDDDDDAMDEDIDDKHEQVIMINLRMVETLPM